MAQIIPEDSLTTNHLGVQLHCCLKDLDESTVCRQQISNNHELIGLRYWINQGKQSLLLATLPDQSMSKSIKLNRDQLSKHPLVKELIAERNALIPTSLQDHAHHLLPIVLLLDENLNTKETIHLKAQGLIAIGKVILHGALPAVVTRCVGIAASSQVNRYLTTQFSPELLIGSSEAPQALKLLDLQQEISLKKGLLPSTHTNESMYSLNAVIGAAGSGKSEVLVKRALLVQKLFPKSRTLVLTHNKSISNALMQSIGSTSQSNATIQCLPFNEWCRKLLGGTWKFVYPDQETELFDLMIKRHFETEDLNRIGLMREISFIKDRNIISESDYLNTIRSSNSLALSPALRKRVWQAMIDIDIQLRDRKSSLTNDAAAALIEELSNGKTVERYTHILIDEAQYFAPVWFTLIKQLITPHGSLYITADPSQGFHNRSFDANETGLAIESCTTQLINHYRCSPAISRVVDNFRLRRSMSTLKPPMHSINQVEPIKPEEHPQLLHFPTKVDQKNRLFSQIHQLIQAGYKANDILILNADIQSTRLLAQEMRDTLRIRTITLTGSMIIEENAVKLCDIESATGLQSKIVFITSLETIFDLEQYPEHSERESHSLRRDHTNLMHMAMTRATERLYLLISTDKVPDSLIIEGLETPTLSKERIAPVRYLNP